MDTMYQTATRTQDHTNAYPIPPKVADQYVIVSSSSPSGLADKLNEMWVKGYEERRTWSVNVAAGDYGSTVHHHSLLEYRYSRG